MKDVDSSSFKRILIEYTLYTDKIIFHIYCNSVSNCPLDKLEFAQLFYETYSPLPMHFRHFFLVFAQCLFILLLRM